MIRSFEEPEGEYYDGHFEEWLTPFWDPLEAPFMVHEHPAPYVGPTPYFVPIRDEPASVLAPQLQPLTPQPQVQDKPQVPVQPKKPTPEPKKAAPEPKKPTAEPKKVALDVTVKDKETQEPQATYTIKPTVIPPYEMYHHDDSEDEHIIKHAMEE